MQRADKFEVRLTQLLATVVTLGQISILNTTAQAKSVDGSMAGPTSTQLDLVINTDAGVDDAAAIDWLLSQKQYPVDILGIGTTGGNATVKDATNNVLTVLDSLGEKNIPVAMGAAKPLSEPLSQTGSLLHGLDGLWGAGQQHDLSGLSHDVPSFYRDLAQAHPGATLLSLGPLTNLAQTWEQYPDALKSFKQIIVLGGAKYGGNITPNAEYNIWQDPDAANELLSAGLPITLVPVDAFNQFSLTFSDLQTLQTYGEAIKLIAGPMQRYAINQTMLGGRTSASFPDVVAAMYAVDSSLGTSQSALVKVGTSGLARGETVIGLTPSERLPMIASDSELSEVAVRAVSDPTFNLQAALGAILAREPDNARLVTNIEAQQMRGLFLGAFVPVPESSSVLGLFVFSACGAVALLRQRKVKAGGPLSGSGGAEGVVNLPPLPVPYKVYSDN